MEKFETHTISPVYPVYDRLAQYFHVPVSAEFEFEFEYKIEKRERTSYHQPPVSIWRNDMEEHTIFGEKYGQIGA